MIYLLLSIIASTLIFVIFKLFERHRINTLQAIVVNYLTACIAGLISYEGTVSGTEIINSKWFLGALFLAFLFIAVFNIMALTAQRNGLSVAAVAGKMSVIIPVIFGIYVYNESVGLLKVSGVILALTAVYLTASKPNSNTELKRGFLLPLLLFIGSGTIDTTIKYIETNHVPSNGIPIFSASIFGMAFVLGLLLLVYQKLKGSFTFNPKSILGGIVLGIINYYSIYFLLKALQYQGLESSNLFTINNVAIVMTSTLIGIILFKERITKMNWIGISLAIVSIVLVTLA